MLGECVVKSKEILIDRLQENDKKFVNVLINTLLNSICNNNKVELNLVNYNLYFTKFMKFPDYLIDDIINEKVLLSDVIFESDVKLFPEKYKNELYKLNIMKNPTNVECESIYRICPSCGHDRSNAIFVTTGSMDEAKKTMYICVSCKR